MLFFSHKPTKSDNTAITTTATDCLIKSLSLSLSLSLARASILPYSFTFGFGFSILFVSLNRRRTKLRRWRTTTRFLKFGPTNGAQTGSHFTFLVTFSSSLPRLDNNKNISASLAASNIWLTQFAASPSKGYLKLGSALSADQTITVRPSRARIIIFKHQPTTLFYRARNNNNNANAAR